MCNDVLFVLKIGGLLFAASNILELCSNCSAMESASSVVSGQGVVSFFELVY